MTESLEISKDIIDLGPDMFASSDLKVINYKGNNYYKACGERVNETPDGVKSSCIKPIGHIRWRHEDSFGRQRDVDFGVQVMDDEIRRVAQLWIRKTGIDEAEIFNVLNALQHAGFTLVRGN